MKTNLFILFFFLSGFLTIHAQNVSMYILELESHTKWESVDIAWNDLRSKWVENCKDENTPQESAKLLSKFESNVKWEAVEKNWTSRRSTWVKECKKASSNRQVAKLLLEFESNIKWSAVHEKWKTRRTEWISELNGIR